MMALMTGAAPAHDFWINPLEVPGKAQYRDLELAEGVDLKAQTIPYIDSYFRRFELLDNRGMRKVESVLGSDPAARVRLRGPGVTWVMYQSVDNLVDMEPNKFESYLREEGLERVLPLWRGSGLDGAPAREAFQRCAKALLWHPGGDESLLSQSLGLPLEIIPLNNPVRLDGDTPLTVRVLFEGEPLSGVTVMALNRQALKTVPRFETDAKGEVRIPIIHRGFWLVKAVHMQRVDRRDADWISYWASLTFSLPAARQSRTAP